ncbi:MAG: M23 family metallopeptidase [Planctomycetes bacterium]|nr:M23 family metallopeptidase [Planctomycetota bacterium]
MNRSFALLWALLLGVAATWLPAQPPVPAGYDLEELPIAILPEVGRRVVSPVAVRLVVPLDPAFLELGTVRLALDDRDITPLLWALVATRPAALEPFLSGAAVRGALALGLGEHRLVFSARNRTGYRHEARTRFTVITEDERRLRAGEPLPAARTSDVTPPLLDFTPDQNAFVSSATPRLEIRYVDEPGGSGVNTATLRVWLDSREITSALVIGPAAASYAVPPAAPLPNGRREIRAEIEDHARNLARSSVTFIVFDEASRLAWSFPPTTQPHIVGHAHHSYQNYSSAPESAYFHHGIDIMEPGGTSVYASAGGLVMNLGRYQPSSLYFEVAIRDADGFLWEYHHIDETAVPQAVKDAYANKTPLPAGTLIGKNVVWPVKSHYGPYFHHIHLNVKDPDGRYLNGLHFLLKTRDVTLPTLYGIYVVPQGGEAALNRTDEHDVVISGDVDIVVRADDTIAPDPYQLGIYEIRYAITELSASEGHNLDDTVLWRFDHLPGGASTTAQVWDVHRQRIRHDGQTYTTQGDYNGRRFYYVVTNSDGKSLKEANCWRTAARDAYAKRLYPDGTYRITVTLRDEAGNESLKTLDVQVRNP